MNKSRFIGVSKVDGFQFGLIRFLPFAITFLVIWRSDFSGTLKYHFELLLTTTFYLAYLCFKDWTSSRQNQLAMYFDEAFMDGGLNYTAEYAENTPARMVLIFFRGDGRGGIQGIIFDSFYVNSHG